MSANAAAVLPFVWAFEEGRRASQPRPIHSRPAGRLQPTLANAPAGAQTVPGGPGARHTCRSFHRPETPGLAFYRKYTEAMLRRYLRMSMDAGRVPSLLGREMFRAKVTSYRVGSFEDSVIFLHDIDRCLERLDPAQKILISRLALQEYTVAETCTMFGLDPRTVLRRYGRALDRLTCLFLEKKILERQSGL